MGKRFIFVCLSVLLLLIGFSFHRCCLEALETAPPEVTPAPVPAPERWEFAVDGERSVITFFLDGNIHDTHGFVHDVAGKVSFAIVSGEALAEAQVSITIRAENLDTNNSDRDERMKGTFLEVEKYPLIQFAAADVTSVLGREGVALFHAGKPLTIKLPGTLDLHGVTRGISLEVTLALVGERLVAEGKAVLNLKDYKIKNPSLMFLRVSDEVLITFLIDCVRESSDTLALPRSLPVSAP